MADLMKNLPTKESKTAYAACILYPDNALELLYAYDTHEDATNCAYFYAGRHAETWREQGYDNEEKRPRIKILALDIKPTFNPELHNEGLKIIGDVAGDFRRMPHDSAQSVSAEEDPTRVCDTLTSQYQNLENAHNALTETTAQTLAAIMLRIEQLESGR